MNTDGRGPSCPGEAPCKPSPAASCAKKQPSGRAGPATAAASLCDHHSRAAAADSGPLVAEARRAPDPFSEIATRDLDLLGRPAFRP